MTNILFTSIGRRGYIADYFKNGDSRKEIRIIGTSCYPETVGFSSCDKSYIVPKVFEEGYIEAIIEICDRESIGAVFSFLDMDVVELSKHKDRFLERGIHAFFPDYKICDMFFDKVKTTSFLIENGMLSPKTYSDLSVFENDFSSSRVSFPVILKGRRGFASIGLKICDTMESLQNCWRSASDVIIQEYCEGEEYNLDLFHDIDGKYIVGNVKRKLAMRSGETDQAISVEDDELQNFCDLFGNSFRGAGPCDVDFIKTKDGCQVIDINPRFGGGYPTSHVAGANYPSLIMSVLSGEILDPQIGRAKGGITSMKKIEIIGVSAEEMNAHATIISQQKS